MQTLQQSNTEMMACRLSPKKSFTLQQTGNAAFDLEVLFAVQHGALTLLQTLFTASVAVRQETAGRQYAKHELQSCFLQL